MKRLKVLWLLIPIVLFAVVWCVQRQRQTSTEYILSRYPEVRGNMGGLREEPTGSVLPVNETIIHAIVGFHWYHDRDHRISNTFLLLEDGDAHVTEDPANISKTGGYVQNVRVWRFTATDLQTVKTTLTKMPPNSEAPPFEDLLFVGFRDRNGWTTRIYNRRNLPAPVRTLIRLSKVEPNRILK